MQRKSCPMAFVGRDEKQASLKTPAWEARWPGASGFCYRASDKCCFLGKFKLQKDCNQSC